MKNGNSEGYKVEKVKLARRINKEECKVIKDFYWSGIDSKLVKSSKNVFPIMNENYVSNYFKGDFVSYIGFLKKRAVYHIS
jgi:hypothetical protein